VFVEFTIIIIIIIITIVILTQLRPKMTLYSEDDQK
jgi:hypothetical protein